MIYRLYSKIEIGSPHTNIVSSNRQKRLLLAAANCLLGLTLSWMPVQKIVLGYEDEVEKDSDVSKPQLNWIPRHSAPIRLKAGVDK